MKLNNIWLKAVNEVPLMFTDYYNLINKILFISIFTLGILSDIDKLKSPIIRIILQVFIIFCIVCYIVFYRQQ